MNVEKQAVKKMLSLVPTMVEEAKKTEEITQQILIVKIYEWDCFLKHVLSLIEQEEKEPHLYINKVGKA
jgi:hypothetical protein